MRKKHTPARQTDGWEERVFPGFLGAACWNAIGIMLGTEDVVRGPEALRQWLQVAGYGHQREFRGAFLVTLHLLEAAFRSRRESDFWHQTTIQARRAWDLMLQDWQG